jgi:hypothetical protein
MDPWEETMVAGLRQEIKNLKEENLRVKEQIKALRALNEELTAAITMKSQQ